MKRITFITTVNENYFYHLPRLLQSISDNFVGAKLVVYCVNVSDHNLNAQFLKNSNVEIEKHEICFDNFEHERGYCSNLRAQALNDVGQRLEDNNFLDFKISVKAARAAWNGSLWRNSCRNSNIQAWGWCSKTFQ